jgi:hypothetical protein
MAHTPKPAIRGMLIYLAALIALGLVVGAIYTVYGRPADPSERSASEAIPKAPATPN